MARHGDDDAGIAVTRRQVRRHIALHAHDFDSPRKAREPARNAGHRHQGTAERTAGEHRPGRIEAGCSRLHAEHRARLNEMDGDGEDECDHQSDMEADRAKSFGRTAASATGLRLRPSESPSGP